MFRVQGLGIKGRTEDAVKMRVEEASICVLARVESAILASTYLYKSTMDSELVGLTGPLWDGYHESRRCSRNTNAVSYITKDTSIRRFRVLGVDGSGMTCRCRRRERVCVHMCLCLCLCVCLCVCVCVWRREIEREREKARERKSVPVSSERAKKTGSGMEASAESGSPSLKRVPRVGISSTLFVVRA